MEKKTRCAPDAPAATAAPGEAPQDYSSLIEQICAHVSRYYATTKPIPSAFTIILRAPGSHLSMRSEFPFNIFRQNSDNGVLVVRSELQQMLSSAERTFGKRAFLIEAREKRGHTQGPFIMKIQHTVARNVRKALEPVSVPEPPQEPMPVATAEAAGDAHVPDKEPPPQPAPAAETAPQPNELSPAPEVELEPLNGQTAESLNSPIDYESMKHWPKDMIPGSIKKVFWTLGIKTGRDIMVMLGTARPTAVQWEQFIARIRERANGSGLKFTDNCEGTLYWWLTKVKKWMEPYVHPPGI